jgi:hypothetical protein
MKERKEGRKERRKEGIKENNFNFRCTAGQKSTTTFVGISMLNSLQSSCSVVHLKTVYLYEHSLKNLCLESLLSFPDCGAGNISHCSPPCMSPYFILF